MIIHDFRCEDCKVATEHFVKSDVTEQECPECGGVSHRVILSAPKPDWLGLAQGESASPEAIDRFEKMHKQQKAKEDKTYADHGDYGAAPGASGHQRHYNDQSL